MSNITSLSIHEILGQGGLLERSLKGFEYRAAQIEMACLVQESLIKNMPAVVEAGTGTGKTFGYLVPIIMSNKKTVISTGTKNLQEQIYAKDLPFLQKVIQLKVDAVIMKGRKNYLCLHRYHQYFSQSSLLNDGRKERRKRLERWLEKTQYADRAELPWLADYDVLWDALSATSEQCLGTKCSFWGDCFLARLRSKAAKSQIIIVNHHLFFADLKVKKSGFGEIIPRFQAAVFDEAHNIEEIATLYFGESLSTNQLVELVNDLEKEIKRLGEVGGKKLKKQLGVIKNGSEQLKIFFDNDGNKGRLTQDTLSAISHGPGREISQGLRYIREKAGREEFIDAGLQPLVERARELDWILGQILREKGDNWLKWYEKRKRSMTLHVSPLDISGEMESLLYEKTRTVVFTSATLSAKGTFDYFRSRLGLPEESLQGIYSSHFDFKKQTLMYIPKDLPPPNAPDFGSEAGHRIMDILKRTEGRALALFTSHHNLNLVYRVIKDKVGYTIYKQGDSPRSVLLDAFRRDIHSVLLATGSFWQGVDVPGEALSCLIIDKLPFESPGEPLVSARIDAIRSQGGNPFMEYQVPSAIISLKQGLGRLLRNSSDRGILSVLDIRIITSRYGRLFLDSLPQVPVSHDLSDISRFIKGAGGVT